MKKPLTLASIALLSLGMPLANSHAASAGKKNSQPSQKARPSIPQPIQNASPSTPQPSQNASPSPDTTGGPAALDMAPEGAALDNVEPQTELDGSSEYLGGDVPGGTDLGAGDVPEELEESSMSCGTPAAEGRYQGGESLHQTQGHSKAGGSSLKGKGSLKSSGEQKGGRAGLGKNMNKLQKRN